MTTRLAPGTRAAARAAGIAAAAAERDREDVLGLDDAAVLASIAEHRSRAQRAQVDELRAVAAWADRHRVSDDRLGDGSLSAGGREMADDLLSRRGSTAAELGAEGVLRLAGEGAFAVHEFAVTDLAVLLQMSEQGARDHVGQVVELRDRLPRLWRQVMAGRLPVWKARRIAEQTIALGAGAAGFVDAHLEAFAHRLSLTRITRCVDAAVTRFHPDLARRRAEAAAESLGVWLDDDATDGTTAIHGVVDTPDAHAQAKASSAAGRAGHDPRRQPPVAPGAAPSSLHPAPRRPGPSTPPGAVSVPPRS